MFLPSPPGLALMFSPLLSHFETGLDYLALWPLEQFPNSNNHLCQTVRWREPSSHTLFWVRDIPCKSYPILTLLELFVFDGLRSSLTSWMRRCLGTQGLKIATFDEKKNSLHLKKIGTPPMRYISNRGWHLFFSNIKIGCWSHRELQ